MGSGTTAASALQEGRHYVGFELDKAYYKVALKRIGEGRSRVDIVCNET